MSNVHKLQYEPVSELEQLSALVREVLDNVRPKRRSLSAETKREHIRTIAAYYANNCPCCGETEVVTHDGQRAQNAEFDHWTDNPSRCRPSETWLVCQSCNRAFAAGKQDRQDFSIQWNAYQQRRKQLERRLRPLLL